MEYEIIVVGGGHAGCEAAIAAAKMQHKVAMITSNKKMIAHMPCNPSIGGPAKGIVVREIDALGGVMGKVADQTNIQMKMLNLSKGPAVWSLRAQADVIEYPKRMIEILENQENLSIIEAFVDKLVVKDNKIHGVLLADGREIKAKKVVLTTGTYMHSHILVGHTKKEGGPGGQPTKASLSNNLRELGINLFRLKTGTPARVKRDSIDFTKTTPQPGDSIKRNFSFDNISANKNIQELCYLTYTNKETHEIINNNIDKSAMYSGLIEGKGPRYCPSIEDKLVRFSDKERHQIFLEPESLHTDSIYLQGLSTSLPNDIQNQFIRTVPGLERCEIIKYGYAIEYDAIIPTELWPSLETKKISGLFSAGQINGTSGYEEAAGQGLIAGINAALQIENKESLILSRDEAYIGVLIDDLVTKGTDEPYRLLTSRAEYRLLLRHDNADLRLRKIGHEIGLISDEQYIEFQKKCATINEYIEKIKTIKITTKIKINEYLSNIGSSKLKDGISLYDLMKRPELSYKNAIDLLKIMQEYEIYTRIKLDNVKEEIQQQIEIQIKYDGYIRKAKNQVDRIKQLEKKKIPQNIDYNLVPNLALEARQKLKEIQPITLGQASRVSGVNPVDISMLSIYIKNR
ncbi:tRNA uridine-5-carboxymethylaminomethyl(34) synthesis enzyme MnmG [Culicoidibacter larvae]|uniref:tRNA uridine 5-carboxymethylaminomethyl modification enzyme MnmG n=1 Tax=Culicoidibacter larvae TaxID=2579976 RepID=A0A5R8QGK6_9FIRM|nr:tRNA uridine-5-carboxymethylaminomethyl(34) synthesis enzyme MnmG [Culicoidibacter larvae]TLG77171.1 tRNA uridine-5-carboxymethylaminomethyl(34) synthesis enzyme MnmG [Culicoidibacter larvae]